MQNFGTRRQRDGSSSMIDAARLLRKMMSSARPPRLMSLSNPRLMKFTRIKAPMMKRPSRKNSFPTTTSLPRISIRKTMGRKKAMQKPKRLSQAAAPL